MVRRLGISAVWLGIIACGAALRAEEPAPVDYLRDVKPILSARCIECHGPQKQKSGLRLDTAAALKEGGDSGSAITDGKPAESLLIQAITGSDGVALMPPKEPRLTAEQIGVLTAWVAAGAKSPADEAPAAPAEIQKSTHWAFQPVTRPELPKVQRENWVRTPIDAFILAKLEQAGLTPSPEADRATLIRRLSLDLLGLLPTPAEVDAFVADESPDAYERLVDRLLESPHYGERWGRHWLDVARYADSNGFTRDMPRSIWKYRDWVINALNRDLPFDEFTIEQMAGDLLPDATTEQKIATGFHRNTLINEEGGTDPEQFRIESVVDRVNTTGAAFLGLTVGCAQCHDHKYDPISQREYYQFFAFLNNADEPKLEVATPEQLAEHAFEKRAELRKQIAELDKDFKARAEEFAQDMLDWEKSLAEEQKKELPFDVLNVVNLAARDRSDDHKKLLTEYYKKLEAPRQKYPALEQIALLRKQEPQFVSTMVLQERKQPRETFVHLRGDFLRHGAKVEPAVPRVLPPLVANEGLANRLALARWLVSAENPLTPRVVMNRFWQKYFGRGLVETENDFGTQGTAPTHPELLDWLASEFIARGWSMKAMHRLIVTSAVYRQSSRSRVDAAEMDPENKLLARQVRLRLDAEIIRDAALSASDRLSPKVGGPPVYPPQPDGVFDFTQDKKPWKTETGDDRYRRAMYTHLWRSSMFPALAVFDFPDANVTCTRRVRSNTPLQSLTLANDLTFVEFAQALAKCVLNGPAASDADRLRDAFRRCLGRQPSAEEIARLNTLLTRERESFAKSPAAAVELAPAGDFSDAVDGAAWVAVSRVLLNLDEFITRE